MKAEQNKTLEALSVALKMEEDGKQCYLVASKASHNDLGRELLKQLADEEDAHRQKFEQIYSAIASNKDWPKIEFQPEKAKSLRDAFLKTCEVASPNVRGVQAELDDLQVAIDKENKSYDFYQRKFYDANYDSEREFYRQLADEEMGHRLVLLDYYELLSDPPGFFVNKEHPSLDG